MPGPLVQVGAVVQCVHGGVAQPTVPNPRVTLTGMPSVTIAGPYAVAGCPFVPPAAGPCATGQWVMGTTRVFSDGQPLVILGGVAVCAPTGTPLVVISAQPRVIAT